MLDVMLLMLLMLHGCCWWWLGRLAGALLPRVPAAAAEGGAEGCGLGGCVVCGALRRKRRRSWGAGQQSI